MFSFSSLLNAGGIYGDSFPLRQNGTQTQPRIQQFKQEIRAQLVTLDEEYRPTIQELTQEIKQEIRIQLAALDERYRP